MDTIGIERLALSESLESKLRYRGVQTLGDLILQHRGTLPEENHVLKRLRLYLNWYLKQDQGTRLAEATGDCISPIHLLVLQETPLDVLIDGWLSALKERSREVIRWRHGLDGEELTLEQVGDRLGVTRERARQIETQALRLLWKPRSREVIHPLAALVSYWIDQAGGLAGEEQIVGFLCRELVVGEADPMGIAHLVLHFGDGVQWLSKIKAWGTASVPPSRVYGVQKRLVQLLANHRIELAIDRLVEQFKATRFYQNQRDRLDDTFVMACLKTCPEIEVDERGMCGLAKWADKRLPKIVLALRQIGQPAHYTIIAEQTNALMPAERRTSANNVRAHLDRRSDIFANLGRGKYWLRGPAETEFDSLRQADFGELFGTRLARWQSEFDRQQQCDSGLDTRAEVDAIRNTGTEFFRD